MPRIRTLLVSMAFVSSLVVTVGISATTQAAILFPGTSAEIPDPFLLIFDENGHATIAVNGGPPTPLTGTLMADPAAPAGSPLALTYLLPQPVVTGTVSFAEPGTGTSDWLRFTDAAGTISGAATGAGPRMIFYSDLEPGGLNPDLADVGPPANITTGNFLACGPGLVCPGEIGLEGSNGFVYQPGRVPYPQNNEYRGTSDRAVPEPASLVLLGSGLAIMRLIVRRRRR